MTFPARVFNAIALLTVRIYTSTKKVVLLAGPDPTLAYKPPTMPGVRDDDRKPLLDSEEREPAVQTKRAPTASVSGDRRKSGLPLHDSVPDPYGEDFNPSGTFDLDSKDPRIGNLHPFMDRSYL